MALQPHQHAAVNERLDKIDARLDKIEKKLALVAEGFSFIANQVRPHYGMAHLGTVFDAVAAKLAK